MSYVHTQGSLPVYTWASLPMQTQMSLPLPTVESLPVPTIPVTSGYHPATSGHRPEHRHASSSMPNPFSHRGLSLSPESLAVNQDIRIQTHVTKSEEVGLLTATSFSRPIPPPTAPLKVQTEAEQELEHIMEDLYLPDAHQMYSYGKRQMIYSPQVPAQKPNVGVAVTHDYIGYPRQIGHEVMHSDDGIHNTSWSHIGPLLRFHDGNFWSANTRDMVLDASVAGADHGEAVDLRGLRMWKQGVSASRRRGPDYEALNNLRNS
eukprot:TRINITY_DN60721_c0_g1_i1.p1 TRINITY_DN60721_c0_g1~~TRINITY_DN60721_c0_g1_i1.p1  ORF type:complete len:262 (+),score=21.71 TRINITY_DN60721_c0_g1_i1:108-893(+)